MAADGKMNIEVLLNSTDEKVVAFAKDLVSADEKVSMGISPLGALGLPKLLDHRRIQYGIPDGAFRWQAGYNRVYIFQVALDNQDTFGSSGLHKPEQTKAREREEAPAGILVSAGLKAMDVLASNGYQLGHLITFLRMAPFRLPIGTIAGKSQYMIVAQVGDICGNEDLMNQLRGREARIVAKEREVDGVTVKEHVLIDPDGKTWNPISPDIDFDY